MSGAFHLFFFRNGVTSEVFLTGNGMDEYTERRSWESQGEEIIARRMAGGIYDWTGGESYFHPLSVCRCLWFLPLALSSFFHALQRYYKVIV